MTTTKTDDKFAIIETGGKQYTVSVDDTLDVEKLDAEVGEEVEFASVLLTADGDDVSVGTPTVSGDVVAEVVEHGRADKIEVMKFKRKKGYKRTYGHRQDYTKVKITSIA